VMYDIIAISRIGVRKRRSVIESRDLMRLK